MLLTFDRHQTLDNQFSHGKGVGGSVNLLNPTPSLPVIDF